MSKLETITIAAPGFQGLNTQDSPVSMPIEFASQLDNAVIDSSGRVAARKGYNLLTSSGAAAIDNIAYYKNDAGTTQVYSMSSSAIYTGTTTMVNAYSTSITASNWQVVQLDDTLVFVQEGHDPLSATGGGAPVLDSLGNDITAAAIGQPNVALASFGRLWVADTASDKSTIWWSDLLDPDNFATGSAGKIDIQEVWPEGSDEITALAAHNGFLVIFGRHSIVVYQGADEPATMVVSDTVGGIGCVARDSVQIIGSDLVFLSAQGVRSFSRTIQEETMPNRDISSNVRDELVSNFSGTNDQVKSVYSQEEAFYVLLFNDVDIAYVFDLRRPLEDGTFRVTKWIDSPFDAMVRDWESGDLYVAGTAGVGTYSGYTDNGSTYFMSYYTHLMHFGQPTVLKFLKKIRPIIIGSSDSFTSVRWSYDFEDSFGSKTLTLGTSVGSRYGTGATYNGTATYGQTIPLNIVPINTNGSGTQIQIGMEVEINGAPFSVQELSIYATIGRTAW